MRAMATFTAPPMERGALVSELNLTWVSLDSLLAELPDSNWDMPTRCPGWSVKDQLAHVVGTEAMLVGDSTPAAPDPAGAHVRNDIGRFNEAWIESMRALPGAEVLDAFRDVTARRRAQLSAMTDEDFSNVGFTPAGQDTYARFMQIRLFDTWLHEQDIRAAVDRPGHASGAVAGRALAEISRSLGFVVGKRAGFPDGASAVFHVDEHDIAVQVVDGRARLVDDAPTDPDATLTTDLVTFAALVGGRSSPADVAGAVTLGGSDAELAARLSRNLAYTI